jgi:vacuolar-type H+-ATPase subunit I/STV1
MSALFDSIKARRDDTKVVSDVESGKFNVYRAGLTPGNEPIILKTEVETLEQALDIDAIREEPSVRKPEIITEIQPVIESIPVTKESTPESMEKYLTQPAASTSQLEEPKSKFKNLFDAINARRDDANIVDNVNKPSIRIVEEVVEKPKSKFSSLFDAINARRDDTNVVENVTKFNTPKIETREEILRQIETLPASVETPKSALSGILDTVKGLLTPKTDVKYPETDNLFDDTNALFDENEDDTQDNKTSQIDMFD